MTKRAVGTKGKGTQPRKRRTDGKAEVETERIGTRRKEEERRRIKRSAETSGVSRLHGFVEPPCYYTDYIFKCAYSGCSSPTLPAGSFFPPSRLSSFTAAATSTIRHVLSIFFCVSTDFMTLSSLFLPRCHISRNPPQPLYLSQTRRKSDFHEEMRDGRFAETRDEIPTSFRPLPFELYVRIGMESI